jgi:hypothetical protein
VKQHRSLRAELIAFADAKEMDETSTIRNVRIALSAIAAATAFVLPASRSVAQSDTGRRRRVAAAYSAANRNLANSFRCRAGSLTRAADGGYRAW